MSSESRTIEQRVDPRDADQPLRVVAAAIKLSDGRVVVGVRHYDQLMRQWLPNEPDPEAVQGFVLSNYRFVTRAKAFEVAKKVGQIIEGRGLRGTLYSEDLW